MDISFKQLSLPVIVTRNVVYFPHNEKSIDAGRKKSINAVNEARRNYDDYIVILTQIDPTVDDPNVNEVYWFGSVGRIKMVKKNDDNSLRIVLESLERIQVVSLEEKDDMFFTHFSMIQDEIGDKTEETALVRRLIKSFEELATVVPSFSNNLLKQTARNVSASQLADMVAHNLPLPIDQKQKLLETINVNARLRLIIESIEEEKLINRLENDINRQVRQKIDENQREYLLREKLRTIKEELGDVPTKDDDTEVIRKLVTENPFPQNVKDKVLEELKRYEMTPPASGESSVIRTYIDWLIKTPWYQKTEDTSDIVEVEKILNEDHFGLEKIKERILEYLAVKQLTQSLKAPIICFSGPPGVGKTSLARSIARALGRKFVKVSLGGVRDEAEIRGHRRTYLGALPGRIIQGMKKSGVINPVFLLDEIDKLGADYKGDPSNALLEVLDPEQNKFFSDHFLEEPYDLSNVMFIATANLLENIPDPLRDRLEIIEMSSYTEIEKLSIARNHLIKKEVIQNGLTEDQISFSDDALMHIIRYYTRESGVRQLERHIGTIARKVAVLILKKDRKSKFKVTVAVVKELLGKEKYEYTKKEPNDQVGVVTGLAYTQFGGDILPVEVSYFEGKGAVTITGNLGKVMSESVAIAISYIHANAQRYNIDPSFFSKIDIHVHFPEGAIPKDGPSAGITMTTALISAFTKRPARANVAMTGEVTLRGNVLPIGGLREKSLAAHRSGIQTIIIPKENEKDIIDIPESVRNDLKIVFVSTIDQVIQEALLGEPAHV